MIQGVYGVNVMFVKISNVKVMAAMMMMTICVIFNCRVSNGTE